MATDRVLSRQQLLESLRNDTLVIPDLHAVLENWPQYVHPELERLREDLEQRLPELLLEGVRLRKTRAADFGLLVAAWYPYASYESLRIVMYLYLWLFMWDDETDSLEFSSLKNDCDQANSFFVKTTTYIQNSLGVDPNASLSEISSDPVITSFEPIGEAIIKSYSKPQITRFYNELARYVQMTELEQSVQLSEKFPTVEEYLYRRLGSSAVDVSTAAMEYCFGIEIPSSVMNEHDMKLLWRETNIIISVMNDILSLKKEMEQGEVDTLIPLLYLQYGTLDAAMNAAMDIIHASISTFEISARRLLDLHFRDKDIHTMLVKFIHACRCACTANLNWSLQSGRYRLNIKSLRNGFTVTL